MFLYAFVFEGGEGRLVEGITAVEAQGLFAPRRCRHRKLLALPHKNRGVRKLLTAPMISFWEKKLGGWDTMKIIDLVV